jgi:YfiR/HmsC-like
MLPRKPGGHRARARQTAANRALWLATMLLLAGGACASDLPEYRLKAAFVYNFLAFTEWPATSDGTLNLCIHGQDPFGREIDSLQGKAAAGRSIAVQRRPAGESLKNCQAVFITASMIGSLPRVLEELKGQPVLTMADSPGAVRQGVALSMSVVQGRVTFAANLQAARSAGLNLSSKLLRLATEVVQ